MLTQILSPRSSTQIFVRTKSSKEDRDDEREFGAADAADAGGMEDMLKEIKSGSMSLNERLDDMGLDPVEYRRYDQHI